LIEWDKIIRNQKYGKPTDGENLKKSLKSENYDSIEIPSFLDGFEKFKNKEEFLAFRDKKGFYNLPKTIQDKYFEEYRCILRKQNIIFTNKTFKPFYILFRT
jgi:hypothetical protein